MTLHLHHLTGCSPTPLAFYLKGLGVLRVVSEQKDEEARGWWQDEHFCLLTRLDRAELERFLLEEYSPTPVFNPWGARSGFYSGGSERSARTSLEEIERSSSPRFAPFRAMIAEIRSAITKLGGTKPCDEETKALLVNRLRKRVRSGGEEWLSAVMVLVGEEIRSPALMGTGGNEGSGSYTSNYFSALVDCVIRRSCDHALGLFSDSHGSDVKAIPAYSWAGSFGQFLPGGEGSAWDLVLAMEGAVLLRSTVALRSSTQSRARRFLASPFYFPAHAVGSGSTAAIDEFSVNKGRRNPGRGEQWFPLWEVPVRLSEVEAVFAEGRCSVRRRHAAATLQAAEAVARLGVARGIQAFARYGYLQRNNMASHFAVPLGRIVVRRRALARLSDDLVPWLDRLHSLARRDTPPDRFIHVERQLADTLFAALTHDDAPARWQAVLAAAVAVEEIQTTGTGFEAGPIPPLDPDWLAATDDGTPEWRLARALGSAAGSYSPTSQPRDPVRHHWLPLDARARRFEKDERRLRRDPRVVVTGRDPVGDLGALVVRRLIEAAQGGDRTLRLVSARGCGTHPADLARVVAGEVDLGRVSALARALMAVRWERWRPPRSEIVPRGEWPDEAWMALRLAHLPWPLADGRSIKTDESIVRRLLAGDGAAAVQAALRRVREGGLAPPLNGACTDPETARLWAAALAFPIGRECAASMADYFEPMNKKEIP